MFKPVRIIWHHTGDFGFVPQFDKTNKYHKTRGFPISSLGFHIGYHDFVEWDGEVRHAREWDEIGAHDQSENLNSLGLGLSGNFNTQIPNEPQIASACNVLGEMMTKYKIPITRIEPHRWDDKTDCPGKLLQDNWLVLEFLKRHPSFLYRIFGKLGVYTNLL